MTAWKKWMELTLQSGKVNKYNIVQSTHFKLLYKEFAQTSQLLYAGVDFKHNAPTFEKRLVV